MKKVLLLLAVVLTVSGLFAQTTILDFESPSTTTTYQYFGSTLDGSVNNVIANPDPTGINTSSMVADHVKPAGAQTWAGAFPNPALQVPADMIQNSQVCIKVWFPVAGNVGIKLEGSSTGGPNWLNLVDVTETNTWTEVCVDAVNPSIEAPNAPATGHVYDVVTLFFNFGVSPTADVTYYWDDLVTKGGGGATEGDITFSVDMNGYAEPFTTAYVSGSFNGWSGDANPLDDSDGDGIWTTTLTVPTGTHEYKFTLDNWAAQEQFNGFETCVIVDPSGQFVNRRLVVSGDATLPVRCYNSCYACGDAVNITIELGSSHITVSPEGLYIAGGGNFGNPGDFPLNDDDGDGVWTATFERQKGFSSFYTFTNGACPDYSCKENIAGQDCADPDNFNDRSFPPVMQDTTIATCFEICTTDTECGGNMSGDVTFQVDMSGYTGTFTTVYVSGSFNGWAGDANPLTDADGDGVWETTINLQPNTYEYKFQLDNWSVDEQFMDGAPCTVTDPSGQFVNRVLEVSGDATVCFEWNTCTSCLTTGVNNPVFDASLFSISPTMASDFTMVYFNKDLRENKMLRLYNTTGTLVKELTLGADVTEQRLNLSELGTGMYLVYLQAGNRMATKKIVKQ